jgi:hypothetical protein
MDDHDAREPRPATSTPRGSSEDHPSRWRRALAATFVVLLLVAATTFAAGESAPPDATRPAEPTPAEATPAEPTPAPEATPVADATPAPEAAPVADASPVPTPPPPPAPAPEPTPAGPPDEAIVRFHSRPDLRPPVISVEAAPDEPAEHLFVTPRYGGEGEGVMIMDAAGELVWLHRVPGRSAAALKAITYEGEPALMWWEGTIERGLGDGEFVIAGQDYRERARIRTVAHPTDLHDLVLTPDGTAYVYAMDVIELDGQPVDDMLVQEVDIATGRLLWEWRASDHIGTQESVEPVPEEGPWDYLHFNSIDSAPDGDLILSARHTDAIYKVSRATGEIVWRLGGTASDFEMAPEAIFRKQHDARWLPDSTISLFDNSTKQSDDPEARPRGLVLRLDVAAGTAEVVRELLPPRQVDSSSQGNLTVEEDGRATIGWGSTYIVTGYDAAGEVTWDGAMPPGFTSYRAYRAPWEGRPLDDPLVAVEADEDGESTAWVSWNGATEVAAWELLAGDDPDQLESAEPVEADGFESALPVPDRAAVIVVRALDADGEALGVSTPIDVREALAEPATAG